MKAKASTKSGAKVNTNTADDQIVLSIGMIVKNEEKYLGKCLEALTPITKTGKVEVVIVDTGSTDKTVSIAKKYTDKVYDFKWIDDFAAARNYGLDRSVGEWFMFLDADEIFDESVVEILKFLESPESKKYNSASYHIRNFLDDSFSRYEEFVPTRIGRRTKELRFVGAIHECLTLIMPSKTTSAVVYHYGYLGQKVLEKKSDRNLKTLYKDYEKDPNSPRTLMYIFNGLMEKNDKERYLKEWIEIADSSKEDKLTMLAYLSATQFYWQILDFRKAAYYAEKVLKVDGAEKNIKSLMAYHYLGDANTKLLNYDIAAKAYENYFKKYKQYQKNELDYYGTSMLSGIRESEYESKTAAYAFCLVKSKKYADAAKVLAKIKYGLLEEDGHGFMRLALSEYCADTREDAKFDLVKPALEAYIKELKKDTSKDKKEEHDEGRTDCDRKFILNKLVADIYWTISKPKKEMGKKSIPEEKIKSAQANVFGTLSKNLSDDYTGMMFDVISLLVNLPEDDNKLMISNQMVQPFLDNLPDCQISYSPIIWQAMNCGCSLCNVLSHSDRKIIEEISAAVSGNVDNFKEAAKDFTDTYQPETIKELYFEIALLRRTLKDHEDMWYPYSMLLANYVSNIYTEDILNEDDITVLSDEERLGFYMFKADKSLQENDKAKYIHFLRLALKVCPGMKSAIKEIADGMDLDSEEK